MDTSDAPSTTTSVHGVLPVFQLPYHDDESIDFETLGREIDWLFEAGADGIVMALASELFRLNDEERHDVATYICQRAGDRGSIVVSVGAESAKQSAAFAVHAESVGASAVMAVPPISTPWDEAQLRNYYERILEATRLPVIVQDASGYVGRPMSIGFQASLWRDHPDRIMFKPEATPIGPRLTALHSATDGKAIIFEGTGGVALVESYRRRISGSMPGTGLIHAIVALWRALEVGDNERVDAISLPLTTLVSKLHTLDAFIAADKHLLFRQGVFRNSIIRRPIGYALDDISQQEVEHLFDILLDTVQKHPTCV